MLQIRNNELINMYLSIKNILKYVNLSLREAMREIPNLYYIIDNIVENEITEIQKKRQAKIG
ncbi:MAG: hypothetical protein GY714_20940 [Desulfobacterales bacterium]|nr:hypothetical protein [Desulfobacterales bacterium]